MRSLFFLLLIYLVPAKEDKVLICKSAAAYAYHSYQCRGLKACTHAIEKVSLQEALAL
ncbi:MAG: hypothetical protein JWR72_3008 [Flavisolibacter sp.]|jgi:hypothetical protein|nr:hypothetical protein [Flavisolibacter sp.]